jgi:DNA polymerase-3 subunit epsilon
MNVYSNRFERDREEAANWARRHLEDPDGWALFDTETTGLFGAEIVQIGLLAGDGSVLMDKLCKPSVPIPPDATRVHGISDEHVALAPCFRELHQEFCEAVGERVLVVYNVGYDRGVLTQTCELYGLPIPAFSGWECAMRMYAQWWGEWNSSRGDYRWQKLQGGDHSAIGDCRATYRLMQRMAGVSVVGETLR